MYSILKKELHSFFSNATGYIVIAIFLLLTGLLLWIIPGQFNILDSQYANLDGLFYIAPWLFLFLCPAISMRLIAEEIQTGTWDLIITKPISRWAIITGKFLAGWALVLLSLIPTLTYYATVFYTAEPIGNVDSGAFWGSFIGLILLSSIYISIGVFASSISKNQIIAFIISVVVSVSLLYGFDLLSNIFDSGTIIQTIESLGINAHYRSISRGVIDSRGLFYFLLITFIFLWLAVKRITRK